MSNDERFKYTTPLDAWVEQAGLEEFRDKELKTHLVVYGVPTEDIVPLTRMIMISLRQAVGGNTTDERPVGR